MAGRLLGSLILIGAAAACGGDDTSRAEECDDTNSCVGATPEDATRDNDASRPASERDAAVPSTLDAGPAQANADAGQSASDAASAPDDPAPPSSEPSQSSGCGKSAPAGGNSKIDVKGQARDYILTLPKSYDPKKPHKLVFAWHGLGGTAAQIARGYYGLQTQAKDDTIFVAGQGLQTSNMVGAGAGWPNTNGQDVAFVKALYAQLQGELCIDESRVFSVGMSYGGIMSNTLGCQMGDVFRAIAPIAGSGPYQGRGAACVGEVATWIAHGNTDTVVTTAQGRASRDTWLKANHCQSSTKPTEPSPCVSYDGCDPGLPVTYCEFDGGHTVPPFAAKAIWSFFSQF